MSISRDEFVAAVAGWFDAYERGDLNALLGLYDEHAVMECGCEGVTLTGRDSIAAYWAPKLERKRVSAFDLYRLELVKLTGYGVQIDYQTYEGKPVRFYFRFGSSNKIIYASCGPLIGRAAKISLN
jgi:hypothetical protein